jgi:hypothetical protein
MYDMLNLFRRPALIIRSEISKNGAGHEKTFTNVTAPYILCGKRTVFKRDFPHKFRKACKYGYVCFMEYK